MPINQPPAPPAKKPPAQPKKVITAAEAAQERLSGRAEAVNGLFQIGTAMCLLAHQYADAATIDEHGENISRECAKVAEDNEQFANLLDKLSTVGPYAGLLTAIMPMAIQIAVNHKRMDPGAMGSVAPEVLTAKVEADIAEKKAELLAQAQEARQAAEQRLAKIQEAA